MSFLMTGKTVRKTYLENFIQKKISIDYDLYSDKLIKTSEIKCNIENNSSN